MEIDRDFWNDLKIEKDLISECSDIPVRVSLRERILRGVKNVFYNIYNYINSSNNSKI